MTDPVAALRQTLRQLQQQHQSGVIDAAAYEAAKAPLERQLLETVLGAEPAAPDAAAAAAAPAPASAAAAEAAEAPGGRGTTVFWATASVLVLAVALMGYLSMGSSVPLGQEPAAFREDATPNAPAVPGGNANAHATGAAEIEALAVKLADRLKQEPNDPEGWSMLGRTYMAIKRFPEALAAYQQAFKLRPQDASVLADLADATAVVNGRTLDGEPTKMLEQALKLDPNNLKALALIGTAAYNRGDFATAVKYWDQTVKVGPAQNPLVEMARNGAAEARERGKLPPAPGQPAAVAAAPTAPAPTGAAGNAAAQAAPAAVTQGFVRGTVRLADALKGQVGPDDAVFIFARAAAGSRMPLALVQKRVRDLPAEFQLDDSQAMSPNAKLSDASSVIVGARISKSGQPMPKPGDFEGLSAPVAVGTQGVVVEVANKLP